MFGIDIDLDLFEPKEFSQPGPTGCNYCGGIISESLVQMLATEGINLPSSVVQRGIESYVLHMDIGTVKIETPSEQKRIAAVHRGAGPAGIKEIKWRSFDGYLQELAVNRGARLIKERVKEVGWVDGLPLVRTRRDEPESYDLLVVATGINTGTVKMFERLGLGYRSPRSTKTYICEFHLGETAIEGLLGSSMHIFLLDIPRLDFAAVIPKGDFVTMCLLGKDIDSTLVRAFLESPEVRSCFPPEWDFKEKSCHCSPAISIGRARRPFADRLVFIGDSGITRLYKDGIGAAYRTSKAAARTAIFSGVSAKDFRRHFWPSCRSISFDNKVGSIVFWVTHLIQKMRPSRRGLLHMVSREQSSAGKSRRMSTVLWDTFTGSAPYGDVFMRTLNPAFLNRFFWDTVSGIWS
jgi:flavin-dependent dehydrogenase